MYFDCEMCDKIAVKIDIYSLSWLNCLLINSFKRTHFLLQMIRRCRTSFFVAVRRLEGSVICSCILVQQRKTLIDFEYFSSSRQLVKRWKRKSAQSSVNRTSAGRAKLRDSRIDFTWTNLLWQQICWQDFK